MRQSGFNPKARWDRHLPEGAYEEPEILSEKIDCLVLFKAGKAFPQVFFWKGKEYKVEKITYAWQERSGREIISYFSLSTGADLYQVSFNNTSLGWRLDKIIT